MSPGLQTLCETCCDAKLDDKDRDDLNVAGFGWELLLPIITQILTQLLSGCFNQASPQEVAAELAKGNDSSKVRAACFRAVGQATDSRISSRKQYKIALGLGDACKLADDAQRMEFVTGIQEATNWELS